MMTEARILFETVIKNNYCIGCGLCATVKDSPFTTEYNALGNIVAVPQSEKALDKSTAKVLEICPFSGKSKNEDELSELYLSTNTHSDNQLGKFESCYAGYVKAGDYRSKGSSGGVIKYLAAKLLEENQIDYFIQLSPNNDNDTTKPLFQYAVFDAADQVIEGSKSSYYPVSLERAIHIIENQAGRYAITGIPCFIKALRLLSEKNPIIKDRLKYLFGIICGGMKSANQSKMIGWQLGVHPDNLIGIDFRRKYRNRPADQKIYQVWSNADHKERYRDVNKIYGSDYGAGFFKPKACDYCDDVVSELADISVGDAWINRFTYDPKGTSLIIIRNKKLGEILKQEEKANNVFLAPLNKEEAIQAQAGGFRHRRQGLSYRLAKRIDNNEWVPEKRVKPGEFEVNEKRKKVYDLREQISEESHIAFKKALDENNLNVFFDEMKGVFNEYRNLNEVSRLRIVLRKIKRIVYYDVLKKHKK